MPRAVLPEDAIDEIIGWFSGATGGRASFIRWLDRRLDIAVVAPEEWPDDTPYIDSARQALCFIPFCISAIDIVRKRPWAGDLAANIAERAASFVAQNESVSEAYETSVECACREANIPVDLDSVSGETWRDANGVLWRAVDLDCKKPDILINSLGHTYWLDGGSFEPGLPFDFDLSARELLQPEIEALKSKADAIELEAQQAEQHPPAAPPAGSFMARLLDGTASLDAIDDEIDAWHKSSLPAFLGMTELEYERWVRDSSSLADIVAQRRAALRAGGTPGALWDREPVVLHSVLDKHRAALESGAAFLAERDRLASLAGRLHAQPGVQVLSLGPTEIVAAVTSAARQGAMDIIKEAGRAGFDGLVHMEGHMWSITADDSSPAAESLVLRHEFPRPDLRNPPVPSRAEPSVESPQTPATDEETP